MGFFHSVILGIIEGLTEFLPVSSTGHLILTSKILRLEETDFLKSFEIAIQFGAILAVLVLYWRSFLFKFEVIKRVAVAFIPTAVLGLVFYKLIKQFLLGNDQIVLWSLFLGGIFLVIFEFFYREKKVGADDVEKISYKQAVIIGFFQSIAIIPGVSRAAATIVGGLILGLKRKTIVEFSFLLAVPTMAAAAGLDLIKSYESFSVGQFSILAVGFVVSFAVALGAIKFFLGFIKKYSFIFFGIYRIILAALFWFILK
jgi:undecaprenyl-diphosphatase